MDYPMGQLKTREWKTWHQIAGVQNTGVSESCRVSVSIGLHECGMFVDKKV